MAKHTPPFVRSAYNFDPNEHSDAHGLECKDPSLTQQQFAEESDINFIAEKYGLTGEMPEPGRLPQYGDFTGVFDFQSAQNAVIEAKAQFLTLPAKMRARFQNDPQQLLEFLGDPDNRKEAEFLGLVEPKENTDGGRSEEVPQQDAQGRTRAGRAAKGPDSSNRPQEPRPEAAQADRRGDSSEAG